MLTSAAVAPVYGKVANLWGRKSALLGAILLLFGGSAICGWSENVAELIAGRAIQGSGAGGIIVLVNISISDLWSPRHRGVFLATTGLVWALSAGVGPLLGGIFSQHLTWRWIFWLNMPCCFAAFAVLLPFLSSTKSQLHTPGTHRKMDWFGTTTIISMTILILLSLDLGGVTLPWNSPKIIGILISGFALLAAFVMWELKGAADPLIPVRLLDSMSKASPLIVCFAHNFVNVSSWYYLPLYFQGVLGASPTRSGVLLMPVVVVQALIGVGVGGIINRYDCIRLIIFVGMALTTVGASLFITIGSTTPLAKIIAIEIVAALGVGATFQAPLIAYQGAFDAADMAVATALFGFIRSISASVSVVLGGVVFQNTFREHADQLKTVLDNATLVQDFSAVNAVSSVLLVRMLVPEQQAVVKDAYVAGLTDMWKMYAAVGGFGLAMAVFIKKRAVEIAVSEDAASFDDSTTNAHELNIVPARIVE